MAIYMKYGSIKGPVTTVGFKDWIECLSFHWGASRNIGTAARGSTNREDSEPSLREVSITKKTDVSSAKLMLDAVAGKLDNKVQFAFTTTTKGKVETFLKFQLENVGVNNFHMSSGGDMPTEHVSLNFTKISKTFTGHDPSISGSPETVGYDLTQMKTT